MALVLKERIVPMAKADVTAVFKGRVYLDDAGLVDAVTSDRDAAPAGFTTAPVVDVGKALVIPELIDLHIHLGYNALPLWSEPARKTPFKDHNTWPGVASYKPKISGRRGHSRLPTPKRSSPTSRCAHWLAAPPPIVPRSRSSATSMTRPPAPAIGI